MSLRALQRTMLTCTLLLVLLIALRGVMQALTFVDAGDSLDVPLLRTVLLEGEWGHAWVLQLSAALVLAAMVALGPRAPSTASMLQSLTVLCVLWAQSGMGHAAGDNWHGQWGRALDTGHLAGGGLWLGTLAVLAMTVLPWLRGEAQLSELATLIRKYSFCARAGVLIVITSGVLAAIVYSGSLGAVIDSRWGKLLLLKLAAMAGVMVMGWYNWRTVTPALEVAAAGCEPRLRRAVRIELALGVTMLAITALLVVSPLPGEH